MLPTPMLQTPQTLIYYPTPTPTPIPYQPKLNSVWTPWSTSKLQAPIHTSSTIDTCLWSTRTATGFLFPPQLRKRPAANPHLILMRAYIAIQRALPLARVAYTTFRNDHTSRPRLQIGNMISLTSDRNSTISSTLSTTSPVGSRP